MAFPREYRGAYLERRRACGFSLYEAVGVARGDREAYARQGFENYKLFGAPHVAIITSDEALGTYGAVDCGAYVNNFLLAAQSLGVASIPQAALASHSKFVREHFGLGDDRLVVCGISFGYEDRASTANGFRTDRAGPGRSRDLGRGLAGRPCLPDFVPGGRTRGGLSSCQRDLGFRRRTRRRLTDSLDDLACGADGAPCAAHGLVRNESSPFPVADFFAAIYLLNQNSVLSCPDCRKWRPGARRVAARRRMRGKNNSVSTFKTLPRTTQDAS